jgi:hypothetical protein
MIPPFSPRITVYYSKLMALLKTLKIHDTLFLQRKSESEMNSTKTLGIIVFNLTFRLVGRVTSATVHTKPKQAKWPPPKWGCSFPISLLLSRFPFLLLLLPPV